MSMSSQQQQQHCRNPRNITALFRRSTFCLQPPGDSYMRRSAFDAMVAGCIPVFFHGASAGLQYRWHLPGDAAAYSVLVPEDDVRAAGGGNASVEAVLRRIPIAEVERMREEVIRVVPRLVYADPRGMRLRTARDAFDVALEGVLAKVAEERKDARRRRLRW
jgi:hypothetical protein